jgi:hypothetical protein
MGWGIVEELYPAHCLGVEAARVRDLSGKVKNIELPVLRLHPKYNEGT